MGGSEAHFLPSVWNRKLCRTDVITAGPIVGRALLVFLFFYRVTADWPRTVSTETVNKTSNARILGNFDFPELWELLSKKNLPSLVFASSTFSTKLLGLKSE